MFKTDPTPNLFHYNTKHKENNWVTVYHMQEDVYRLYANTTFHIKNLSICEFWYAWEVVLQPISWGHTKDDCNSIYYILLLVWSYIIPLHILQNLIMIPFNFCFKKSVFFFLKKVTEEKKKKKSHLYLSLLVVFISSCRIEFPSGIIAFQP